MFFLFLILSLFRLTYGFVSIKPSFKAFKVFMNTHSSELHLKSHENKQNDVVWSKLRNDAEMEAKKEPLLASFIHASILSHQSLENSLSFLMANQLSSSAILSTQIQSLFLEASEKHPGFRTSIRKDIMAVVSRDPAVKSSTDVLLYFKGFQALQTQRVSNYLWNTGRRTLALFLHSRANTVYQIDIHPGAKFGDGIMIDHGTGVVIGETAVIGNDVSMLHKVTLGGSGKESVKRHPTIGDGVLLGAGATLIGNINIGEGSHIGACSMVLEDIPPFSIAVGVPVKIVARRDPLQKKEEAPAFTMKHDII